MREELDSIIAEMRETGTPNGASGPRIYTWADRLAALAPSTCTCPSGDGSLRWPCPTHPPATSAPGVDDAMVRRACLAYECELDGQVYGPEVPETAMRSALNAALTQPTEGSGPSVAGGER